jgi:Leucine-rich repeat (LRR) protein
MADLIFDFKIFYFNFIIDFFFSLLFACSLHLIRLYLNNNSIKSIDKYAFFIDERALVGPGLIEKIDLSLNKLEYLNDQVFSYLTNLRYLILNNNMIKYIEARAFYGVNFLITLDLSMNQLRSLDFLSTNNFTHLRHLRLANNLITTLNAGQFVQFKSLRILDMSSNLIDAISDCAFNGLEENIRKLILNNNLINKINSCSFTLNFKQLRMVQILFNPLNCSSNNCEFFFSVYHHPYSINYMGLECINNSTVGLPQCTKAQYEKIYKQCRNKTDPNHCEHALAKSAFAVQNLNYLRQKDQHKIVTEPPKSIRIVYTSSAIVQTAYFRLFVIAFVVHNFIRQFLNIN